MDTSAGQQREVQRTQNKQYEDKVSHQDPRDPKIESQNCLKNSRGTFHDGHIGRSSERRKEKVAQRATTTEKQNGTRGV